jgi:hypothetical protein
MEDLVLRQPKPEDRKNVEIANGLLVELILLHPHIDMNVWISGMFYLIVGAMLKGQIPKEAFRAYLEEVCAHYDEVFEERCEKREENLI